MHAEVITLGREVSISLLCVTTPKVGLLRKCPLPSLFNIAGLGFPAPIYRAAAAS